MAPLAVNVIGALGKQTCVFEAATLTVTGTRLLAMFILCEPVQPASVLVTTTV